MTNAALNRIRLTSELKCRQDEARASSNEETMNKLVELEDLLHEIFNRGNYFDVEVTIPVEDFYEAIITALSIK